MTASVLQKALITGAFLFVSQLPTISVAEGCPPERIDARATVEHVYDGDTVRLRNGDKLRIVGINTPELGRDGKPSEPFSRKAQRRLTTLLRAHDNRIELRYAQEPRDRYKRLLAHTYTPDGQNLSAVMLRDGLAARVTVPPNTHHFRCYRDAEFSARRQHRGIWSQADAALTDINELAAGTRGFRIVRGRISSIKQQSNKTILVLQDRLLLHVDKRDYSYFESGFIESLRGKTIRVRGWISGGGIRLKLKLK